MDFGFITDHLPSSTMGWVNVTALAVACSSGLAAAVSKLTKNKTDDKIAGWLRKAHDLLAGVGLHGATLDQKRAGAPVNNHVRDQRTVK
jgi:hypothetical protein